MKKVFTKISYILTLFNALFFVVILPLLGGGIYGNLFIKINLTLLFISSFALLQFNKKEFTLISYIFVLCAILLSWVSFFYPIKPIIVATAILNLLVFIKITLNTLISLLNEKNVDSTTLIQVINGYLLMGISAGVIFSAIYMLNNNSFIYNIKEVVELREFIYYGFVVFTSLGFGDIVPASDLAKSATTLWAILGQLYTSFVIAIIVGKYLSKKNN